MQRHFFTVRFETFCNCLNAGTDGLIDLCIWGFEYSANESEGKSESSDALTRTPFEIACSHK